MKHNILVVDDDQSILSIFELILDDLDCNLMTALSGEVCLRMLQDKMTLDLVFLDIKLPHNSGLEILAAIREISPATTVIMMTGYAIDDNVKEALSLGANDVIYKPFDVDEIETAVQTVMQNKTIALV